MFGTSQFNTQIYDAGITPRMFQSRSMPLYIGGYSATDIQKGLNLVVKGDPQPHNSRSLTLTVYGSTAGTTIIGGIPLSTTGMTLSKSINLLITGFNLPASNSSVLNMVITGGNLHVGKSIPLAVWNTWLNTGYPLFLSIFGISPGSVVAPPGDSWGSMPIGKSLLLYIQRRNDLSLSLYLENKSIISSLPMMINSKVNNTGFINLFTSGYGGNLTSGIPLFVSGEGTLENYTFFTLGDLIPFLFPPRRIGSVAGTFIEGSYDIQGNINLSMPNIMGEITRELVLYINGWRP